MDRIHLSIDIETYCELDLSDVGVYAYASHPSFEILMAAVKYGADDPLIYDFTSPLELERFKHIVLPQLSDSGFHKYAFNATFELTCFEAYFDIELPTEQWTCTMVQCYVAGFPGSLDRAAKALNVAQKDSSGKNLINYFSKPCRPTVMNGGRTRNLWSHAPQKWEDFKYYCMQDTVSEYEVYQKVRRVDFDETERAMFVLDRKINKHGIKLDTDLVNGAVNIDIAVKERLRAAAIRLTGVENPNSLIQCKQWLSEQLGKDVTEFTEKSKKEMLRKGVPSTVATFINMSMQMSKTSVSKYTKMADMLCPDGRIRGILQFRGAARTARWAGRGVQVQNLTKHKTPAINALRDAIKTGDPDTVDLLFGEPLDYLSQAVRTAIVAEEGSRFIVADSSAIEARIIAWYCNCRWRLEVFATHGKIYEASAAKMFKVPIESITKDSPLRQKGKVAELALGFQGSVGAMLNMGALDGIIKPAVTPAEYEMLKTMDEDKLKDNALVISILKPIVDAWRAESPEVKQMWRDLEDAAMLCVKERRTVPTSYRGITFRFEMGAMTIELPSGRKLIYPRAHIANKVTEYGLKETVAFMAEDARKQWSKQHTYGGHLTENIVQATARDCLRDAMLALDSKGYEICMHVHDEIVAEMPYGKGTLAEMIQVMSKSPSWAKDLPMNAAGFESTFYMKD